MLTPPVSTTLLPHWTDSPPFNNAVNTILASISLVGVVVSICFGVRSMLKDRHNLMYQDNGIAGLICCYPFRVLDRRQRRKEAGGGEQRVGCLARGEEPLFLLPVGIQRTGAGRVEGTNEEASDDNKKGHSRALLRGDGTRVESIDITRI